MILIRALKHSGFTVGSFGVGTQVKLPGQSQSTPNIYAFGTKYTEIYEDLKSQNEEMFTRNGMLEMIKRDVGVKEAPQKFQENTTPFDIIVTFEEIVMDKVLEHFARVSSTLMRPVAVINLDVKDSHEEAAIAAPAALQLCSMIDKAEEWEDELESLLERFHQETGRRAIYNICFH